MLTISELLKKDFTGKAVLIIGNPLSGKTRLSRLIASEKVIHTDMYLKYHRDSVLDILLYDIGNMEGGYVIEGVLGYRLLRKGVREDCWYPDVVIEVVVSDAVIEERCKAERDISKLGGIMKLVKGCETILADYKSMDNDSKPEWILVDSCS